jgi:hypothetical protein
MKKVTRRGLRGHFHSPVVPAGHENLRRIRKAGAATGSGSFVVPPQDDIHW